MTDRPSTNRDAPLRSFGRRHGKRLTRARAELLESLLPKLRVSLPVAGGAMDPKTLFSTPPDDVWLEIGFGAGEHLAAQARARGDVGFIGCEPFINGLAALLGEIEKDNLANVRVLDDDARLLLDALPDGCLGRVFILFPDPWPKARHWKRRIFSTETLDRLARVMKAGAELRFATDHMAPDGGYLRWALGVGVAHPGFEWTAEGPSDWRGRPPDWVETRYERKALGQGLAPVCLCFRRTDKIV